LTFAARPLSCAMAENSEVNEVRPQPRRRRLRPTADADLDRRLNQGELAIEFPEMRTALRCGPFPFSRPY
jgi:hypothetical protein